MKLPDVVLKLLIFSFVLFPVFVFSQGDPERGSDPESLWQEAEYLRKKDKDYQKALEVNTVLMGLSLEDSTRAKGLKQRMAISFKIHPLDSVVAIAEKLEDFVSETRDSALLADTWYRLAYYQKQHNKYAISQENSTRGLNLAIRIGDSAKAADIAQNLCALFADLSNYRAVERTALKGLEFSKDSSTTASLLGSLATASGEMGNYEEKLYWLEKSRALAEDPRDTLVFANNRAITWLRLQQPEKALEQLELLDSVQEAIKTTDPYIDSMKFISNRARVKSNLGLVYRELGIEGSMSKYLEAEAIWKDHDFRSELPFLYLRMAEAFPDEPRMAIQYARSALDYARETGNTKRELAALKKLTSLSANPKQYAMAYQQLNDSMTKLTVNSSDAFARYEYDVAQTRERNLTLQAEADKQQLALNRSRILSLTMGIGVVLLLLAGFQTIRHMRARNHLEQLKAVAVTESRIAKRIHDELANDVYNAMTFAERSDLNETPPKHKLLEILENIYQRTRNISRQNAPIPLGEHYGEALSEMLSGFGSSGVNVLKKGISNISWTTLSPEKQQALFRTLQELMVNMKKHSKASLVMISFSPLKKGVEVTYKDNGKGMTLNGKLTGGGLENATSRVDHAGGALELKSQPDKGFQARIVL